MSDSAANSAAVVTGANDAEAMALAAGVMDTIVQIAVADVEGVAGLGTVGARRRLFGGKEAEPAVAVSMEDDGTATVSVHLSVEYGQVLPDVAAAVRKAVADALASQVGIKANRIDIFVDAITVN